MSLSLSKSEAELNAPSANDRLAALRKLVGVPAGDNTPGDTVAGAGREGAVSDAGTERTGTVAGAGREGAMAGAESERAGAVARQGRESAGASPRTAAGDLPEVLPPAGREVNNHVHTTFSFSPYSPTAAAWHARKARLAAVGSIDHDSIGAAAELRSAASLLGMGSTTGVELRADFRNTAFGEKPLNNPDGGGVAYVVIHAVPERSRDRFAGFLRPIRAARSERSRRMTERLSERLVAAGCDSLDYDRDVLPLSEYEAGGGITERHILYAAAGRMLEAATGTPLAAWLGDKLGIAVPDSLIERISDDGNPYLRYDLLGLCKRELLPELYIYPGEQECLPVEQIVAFALEVGAVPAYPYLGDIVASPTGDKRPARFEDAILDELIPWVRGIGFPAVTYMPPRNTREQLDRVAGLCRKNDLIEISGVDINSPRQSFNCPEVLEPENAHLIDSAWALVVHERVADVDPELGLSANGGALARLSPLERVQALARVAGGVDWRDEPNPGELAERVRSGA